MRQVITHVREFFCDVLRDESDTDGYLLVSPKKKGTTQTLHFYAEFQGTALYVGDMPATTANATIGLSQAIILALCRSHLMTGIVSNPAVFAKFTARLNMLDGVSDITLLIQRLCQSEFSVIDDLIRTRTSTLPYKHTHTHTNTHTEN